MEIKAGNAKLRVDYKRASISYNARPSHEVEIPIDDATQSIYPFDSTDVDPYATVSFPEGTTILRVVEYKPSVAPSTPDVG